LRFFFSIAARYKSRAAFLLFYTAFGTSKRPKSVNPSSSQKTKNRMNTGSSSIHAVFFKLRQQESNLRWGSQSPLPYRLAMAHYRYFSCL
jgi:hypothetical protein